MDKGAARHRLRICDAFEDLLNKKLKTGDLRVHVVMIPLARDMLIPALQDGRIDVIVA